MKVLLLNGSPHETGCTYTALQEAAAALEKQGIETEIFQVGTQPVAGCATGASHAMDVETAARFAVEVAKDYGEGKLSFYDQKEFDHLIELYGTMNQFQTFGKGK